MVATIDLYASRTAIGGGGGEESAPIDDLFYGLSRGRGSGRCQRLWRLLEPWSGGRRRRVGPSVRTGEPGGRRAVGSARGRACDVSAVLLHMSNVRKKSEICRDRRFGIV
tara:strand:+ start:656 stop:985 length:330 start_codon:yes stop_codon:yes gene_type:complete